MSKAKRQISNVIIKPERIEAFNELQFKMEDKKQKNQYV